MAAPAVSHCCLRTRKKIRLLGMGQIYQRKVEDEKIFKGKRSTNGQ